MRGKAAAALGLVLCLIASCNSVATELLQEIPSPSGKLKAVIFEEIWMPGECALVVSILRSSEPLDSSTAALLVFDGFHSSRAPDSQPKLPVELVWLGESEIRVDYGDQLTLLRQNSDSRTGVRVTVEKSPCSEQGS